MVCGSRIKNESANKCRSLKLGKVLEEHAARLDAAISEVGSNKNNDHGEKNTNILSLKLSGLAHNKIWKKVEGL